MVVRRQSFAVARRINENLRRAGCYTSREPESVLSIRAEPRHVEVARVSKTEPA
jgi:hypothetical protein